MLMEAIFFITPPRYQTALQTESCAKQRDDSGSSGKSALSQPVMPVACTKLVHRAGSKLDTSFNRRDRDEGVIVPQRR
jgi:hypothetical protein